MSGALPERPSRADLEREHFDRMAPHFDEVHRHERPSGRARIDRRIRLFREALGTSDALDILEIGCGTGAYSERIAVEIPFRRLVCTDISAKALSIARTKVPDSRVEFRQEDLMRSSLSDGEFGAVLGNSILHHLDLARALAELRRILVPGGLLVLSEPNMVNPQVFLTKKIPFLKRRVGDTPEETAFVRWTLPARLREAGFEPLSIRPFDFLHPWTPAPLVGLVSAVGRVCERAPVVREIAGSLLIVARSPEK
ncbi:MAG: methyltransferase domain-containing protein [Planctomycetes bacterium]|nr:methyltransferase domain-containing protein [Planctomycetota bacterium]